MPCGRRWATAYKYAVGGAYVHTDDVVGDSTPKKSAVSTEHRTQTVCSDCSYPNVTQSTYHPTQVSAPYLNPDQAGTRFIYPGGRKTFWLQQRTEAQSKWYNKNNKIVHFCYCQCAKRPGSKLTKGETFINSELLKVNTNRCVEEALWLKLSV